MVTTHNLGFPRIGEKRELKFALEKHWKNELSASELQQTAQQLRQRHWQQQSTLDLLPVADFSLYDQVLDTSFMLGNIPSRVQDLDGEALDNYFRVARGRSSIDATSCCAVSAGEMTKWFDTNYHYIVPEFNRDTHFSLHADTLLGQIKEAQQLNRNIKPVIIGPLSYLWLGKARDNSNKLLLLNELVTVYAELLQKISDVDIEWLQIDEPILVTELSDEWQQAFRYTYNRLKDSPLKILLATYFGQLQENLPFVCELPVDGLHVDTINAKNEVEEIITRLPDKTILSLGIIDGRNIWKTDLNKVLDWLTPIHQQLADRLWIAPSCSLLHVPVDLKSEEKLNPEIKSWLSFAVQKLAELTLIGQALNQGRNSIADKLEENKNCIQSRRQSALVNIDDVKVRTDNINEAMSKRHSDYVYRSTIHEKQFKLPLFPTTTIGSFPQTAAIRKTRRDYKNGLVSEQDYKHLMQKEIAHCIKEQEILGIDVLVHGEPERNDMVEYFGEQLSGYAFTQFGWVQSYGSRCVKPPIIYGDISRPKAMTVEWTKYAQSLTEKPMKGMLTGPVTILNWSFVRDDKHRSETCLQLALAIRDEVLDLEAAGVNIIQIDEAALREGLPLRKSEWCHYLDWAINAFRITANGVKDTTQIHTHMCYSEFNDIIDAIAKMDADVITIETSRSDMELLDVFDKFSYPNQIGPGVYDIHSPNTPSVEAMMDLIRKAAQRIPVQRLWVNPDCGLKTRQWDEVKPALINMVKASKRLSEELMA